ncbi:MAG TPA: hypothetical protein VG317_06755 [Pseudonocardiaceae bacterium]|nr:hypothetical protein [Pseudonocardiaceae bacterium]
MADRLAPLRLLAAIGAGCAVISGGCAVVTVGPATTGMAQPAAGSDRALIAGYFDRLNATGATGVAMQQAFFARTQHPDYRANGCGLGGWTVRERPAWPTLRRDPGWTPSGGGRPRGVVYLIAVAITVREGGHTVGDQIGAEHVVVLDGGVYGFAPCMKA